MGIAYIILSILCSLLLAQALKFAENKKLNVFRILTVNYLTAVGISAFNLETDESISFSVSESVPILLLILLLGTVFILNLMVYSRSIHRVGMGISFAAMRMSLIFPIAVSLFIFGESIYWIKYIGIFLALYSLFLMIPTFKTDKVLGISDVWLPVLIFLMTGFADTGMKIYEEVFSSELPMELFLGGIFLISSLIGFSILLYRKEIKFEIGEIGLGIFAGLVNLYASVFLIKALQLMPGSVVFPLINVTLVVTGTLIGVFIWKDRLVKKQWLGLGVAILSIILLV